MDVRSYRTTEVLIDEVVAKFEPGPTARAAKQQAEAQIGRCPYGYAWKLVEMADRGYCLATAPYTRIIRLAFKRVVDSGAREKFHEANRLRWLAYRRAG